MHADDKEPTTEVRNSLDEPLSGVKAETSGARDALHEIHTAKFKHRQTVLTSQRLMSLLPLGEEGEGHGLSGDLRVGGRHIRV